MLTNELRAHDLALLFVKHQMEVENQNSDFEYDEDTVLDMYKTAYDNFYDSIQNP